MKRRIYSVYEAMKELGKCARLNRKRSYMWIETGKGPAKALNPRLDMNTFPPSITCDLTAEPRWQVKLTNY